MALPLECTYDFEVTAAKYLHALRDGAVPLQFLFSGTIFVKAERGFSVQQVSWDCEDRYDMPVCGVAGPDRHSTIRTPAGCGWATTPSPRLADYKSARGLLDLDHAVTALLAVDLAQEVAR